MLDGYFKAGLLIGVILIAGIGGSLACRKGIQTTTPVDRSLEKVSKTFPTPPPGVTPSLTATEPSPGGPSAPSGSPDQVVAGESILASRCGACHPGGKKGLGPSLMGYDKTNEQFVAAVRQGGR